MAQPFWFLREMETRGNREMIGRQLFEGAKEGKPMEEQRMTPNVGSFRLEEGDDPKRGLGRSGPRPSGGACWAHAEKKEKMENARDGLG
jgi:hypothetical protein